MKKIFVFITTFLLLLSSNVLAEEIKVVDTDTIVNKVYDYIISKEADLYQRDVFTKNLIYTLNRNNSSLYKNIGKGLTTKHLNRYCGLSQTMSDIKEYLGGCFVRNTSYKILYIKKSGTIYVDDFVKTLDIGLYIGKSDQGSYNLSSLNTQKANITYGSYPTIKRYVLGTGALSVAMWYDGHSLRYRDFSQNDIFVELGNSISFDKITYKGNGFFTIGDQVYIIDNMMQLYDLPRPLITLAPNINGSTLIELTGGYMSDGRKIYFNGPWFYSSGFVVKETIGSFSVTNNQLRRHYYATDENSFYIVGYRQEADIKTRKTIKNSWSMDKDNYYFIMVGPGSYITIFTYPKNDFNGQLVIQNDSCIKDDQNLYYGEFGKYNILDKHSRDNLCN